MKTEKYQIMVARYLIGDFPTQQFPELASDALGDGFDGPTIIEIAGLKQPSYFDIQELLPKLFDELRLPSLTKQEAGLFLAKAAAKKIASGEMDPEEGAKELERLWIKLDYCLDWLQNFSSADDSITSLPFTCKKDDLSGVREKIRKRIVSDAKDYLEGKPLKTWDWDMKNSV